MRIDRIGFSIMLKGRGDLSHLFDAYAMLLFRTDLETVQKIFGSLSIEEQEYLADDHSSFTERKQLIRFVEIKYQQCLKKH